MSFNLLSCLLSSFYGAHEPMLLSKKWLFIVFKNLCLNSVLSGSVEEREEGRIAVRVEEIVWSSEATEDETLMLVHLCVIPAELLMDFSQPAGYSSL